MSKNLTPVMKNLKYYSMYILAQIVKQPKLNVSFVEKALVSHKTSTNGYFKFSKRYPFVEYIPIYHSHIDKIDKSQNIFSDSISKSKSLVVNKIDNTLDLYKGNEKITHIHIFDDNFIILDAKIYSPKCTHSDFLHDYPNGINITNLLQSIYHTKNIPLLKSNSITFKDLLQFTNISYIFDEYPIDTLYIDIMYDETYHITTYQLNNNME